MEIEDGGVFIHNSVHMPNPPPLHAFFIGPWAQHVLMHEHTSESNEACQTTGAVLNQGQPPRASLPVGRRQALLGI